MLNRPVRGSSTILQPNNSVLSPIMAHTPRKRELPTKVCAQCGRLFAWRKKWARDWDNVRYCSQRCRQSARARSRR
jgi:hypothetical protein